jgi:transmembrane sensor
MYSKIKELFERYQSGAASPEERELVDDWFSGFDDQQELKLNNEKKSLLFSRMDKKMAVVLQKRNHYTWLKVAATLIGVISIGLTIYRFSAADKSLNITYQTIRVPNGVKQQLQLPDSSIVYLNSGSSITIPSNFGEKKRFITLTGEAFFEVKHNARKPFTISTSKLQITDIGTSFNVKAYPEEKLVKVAVKTGEVKVEKHNPNGKPEVFARAMVHNQQLTYEEAGNSHKISNIKSESIAAWHNNRLRFDNASFPEIAAQLKRWYNVDIKLNDFEKSKRYTVSFGNEPINNVLTVLAKLSGATYQISDKTILINLTKTKKNELTP